MKVRYESQKDIENACKFAAADEFINKLPNKYETIIFHVKFKSERCSDKTVPYNKCLELTAPTELKITKDDAPAENNWRKIW